MSRKASDIVSIGLGAGSSRFSSAGAFARSLSNWRTFDPGEFYVTPTAPIADSSELSAPNISTAQSFPGFQADAWVGDEMLAAKESPAIKRDPNRGVRAALVAAMLLALLAGVLVLRGSDAAVEPTVLPPQIEVLAELGGF